MPKPPLKTSLCLNKSGYSISALSNPVACLNESGISPGSDGSTSVDTSSVVVVVVEVFVGSIAGGGGDLSLSSVANDLVIRFRGLLSA